MSSPSISSVGSSGPSSTAGLNTIPKVNGLASGLNTDGIIKGLLAINQAQISNLTTQQAQATQKNTAFQSIEAKLLSLQADTSQLSQAQRGVFDSLNATSSNPNLVTAAASSSAAAGVYALQVNSLAKAEQVASQGYSSATSAITQGTFRIGVGSGTAATITIDSSNNTLQGLASAINRVNLGVSATVVNDGGGGQSYRLLLASNQTGTDNAVTITNNLAADNNGAQKLVFGANYVSTAVPQKGFTGTATPTANTGAGGYTGTSNNTYTFTVSNGGTVGQGNTQLSFTDAGGKNTGTINVGDGYTAGSLANVAQGIQVALASGNLVAGQAFTVRAFVPTVQQATNASVTLGSGSGAITVQSDTNQVNDLINGVTLNLTGADSSQTVKLTIAPDTQGMQTAITNFVNDYNGLIDMINQETNYNPTTKQASLLLGDSSVMQILNEVRSAVTGVVPGVNTLANNLSVLGIQANAQGDLNLNTTKLTAALSGQVPGVSLTDISNLFTLSGNSNNPGIQFVGGGSQTRSSTTPYQVKITQAATQGQITAGQALATSVTIDDTNNNLSISVDGGTASVTLAAGTYSSQALAQEVQKEINASPSLAGRQVAVTVNANNQLVIASNSYGSSSKVAVGSGSALSILGFAGTESGSGKDVAGSFIVGGVTEAATGLGQLLTGNQNNTNTAGLAVRVSLTPDQVQSGNTGSLTVTGGIAARLGLTLNALVDPANGRLKTIEDGYQTQVNRIQTSIDQQNALLAAKQQLLEKEFANMESVVAQLQTTGQFLTTALNAAFPGQKSGSSSSGLSVGSVSSG